MKIHKIFIVVLAAALSLLCCCGCSAGNKDSAAVPAATLQEYDTFVVSEQESRDEALYVRALEEENAMHYTYAKELFSQVIEYKDAGAHYGSLIKTLEPYNGVYHISAESGSSYTITINSGVGSMSWDNLTGSVYTLNLYGMYFKDVSDEVSMVFDVNLGKEDWNYAGTQDRYILELDDEDNVNVQGIDGNREHIWDGSGERTDGEE